MIAIDKKIEIIQKDDLKELEVTTVSVKLFNSFVIFSKKSTEEFKIKPEEGSTKPTPIGFKNNNYVDQVYIEEDDF